MTTAAGPAIRTEQNTFDFFYQHVRESLQHQHITITASSEHYLVNLLVDYTRSQRAFSLMQNDGRPLALIYHQAHHEAVNSKIRIFKELGDFSLFTAGFFPDSFNRKVTDVDYYVVLGRSAYGHLSLLLQKISRGTFHLLYEELAAKFVSITNILSEISSTSAIQWNDGILRVYERWLKTRSRRDERLLFSRGVIPNRTIDHRTRQ